MQRSLVSAQTPLQSLTLIFIIWKSLIALIAISSPGVGYDTSSDLLTGSPLNKTSDSLPDSLLKFVRWDAIYYTESARRGHVFEQEWAFGKGLQTPLAYVAKAIPLYEIDSISRYASAGLFISHAAHWLSAILLFFVTDGLQDPTTPSASSIPFIAAIFCIISPAGIFLSAPYSESLFSCLSMLGYLLYIKGVRGSLQGGEARSLVLKFVSGIAFGLAAAVRGNGILSGIPFFIDAVDCVLQILNPRVDNFAKSHLFLQLQFTVLAGCCVAAGTIYPQFLAYREYCADDRSLRPWCTSRLPSIYSFVQSHYWNVGFLRYWTVSNLPLFLLATPSLCLLIISGYQICYPALRANSTPMQKLRLRLALPQLVLAVLALTNYHVQIITRLSSGYPMWYIWLATGLKEWKYSNVTIRIMVLYALIQAGLYASFLPPA